MDEEVLRARLKALIVEHRDLDAAIAALDAMKPYNHLQIQRLKKRKLALKDEISRIEDQLIPDIIA
ncbi:MAG: DUF465 domain-containing protein [Alphaproteobacteria bacterium]|nr:MAG: DUF465 domain-containing protein [Alphaproteobacteria bacterium]